MIKRILFLSLALVAGAWHFTQTDAAENTRVTGTLNIVFVDYCDGLDLDFRPRLGITGRHTGCGQNERVEGVPFTTADGELGITVTYFDRTIRRPQRIDLFQSGFRGGNFYVYDGLTGELQRFGEFAPTPPFP